MRRLSFTRETRRTLAMTFPEHLLCEMVALGILSFSWFDGSGFTGKRVEWVGETGSPWPSLLVQQVANRRCHRNLLEVRRLIHSLVGLQLLQPITVVHHHPTASLQTLGG
jgi:hypothetical protein